MTPLRTLPPRTWSRLLSTGRRSLDSVLTAVLSLAIASCAGSIEARYGTVLRRGALAKVQEDLVDVAPSPAFRRIVALDDRMMRRVKVPCGVAVGRLVAAADMSARPAKP